MMTIEAIKHYEAALKEAFPRGATGDVFEHWNKARIAIAEAEKQEPVAWGMESDDGEIYDCITPEEHAREEGEYTVALYREPQPNIPTSDMKQEPVAKTAKQRHEWVGLTDEEVVRLKLDGRDLEFVSMTALRRFARAIEAKLKEKNT